MTAFTARACNAAGLARDACLRFTLLVEDLFTNTVAHGHGQDSEAPVRLAFDVTPGRVGLLYEDTGPPHDPFAAVALPDDTTEVEERPVGGLGLVLIAALASEAHYRRENGKNLISLTVTGPVAGSASPAHGVCASIPANPRQRRHRQGDSPWIRTPRRPRCA